MHTLPLPPRECRTTDRRPRVNEPAQQHGYGQPTGRWYYVITWVSLGLLAAVPFFHAASQLNRPALRKTGTKFAVASVVGMVLIGVAVHGASFLEMDKPQPVVLFELVKGFLTGQTAELGEMHHVRR